jgi:hypothetical protein
MLLVWPRASLLAHVLLCPLPPVSIGQTWPVAGNFLLRHPCRHRVRLRCVLCLGRWLPCRVRSTVSLASWCPVHCLTLPLHHPSLRILAAVHLPCICRAGYGSVIATAVSWRWAFILEAPLMAPLAFICWFLPHHKKAEVDAERYVHWCLPFHPPMV